MLNNIPEDTSEASKLWISGPQDSTLQHFLEHKAGPEGDIKQYQKFIFKMLLYTTTILNKMLLGLKLALWVVLKSTHNVFS